MDVQCVAMGRRLLISKCLDDAFPCRWSKTARGSADSFPGDFFFFFFLIQRLTEPILANFGLKPFQSKRRKADTCSSYEHGHFVMAPWGSTVLTKFHRNQQQEIVGRNKQEKGRKAVPLKAKQEVKQAHSNQRT